MKHPKVTHLSRFSVRVQVGQTNRFRRVGQVKECKRERSPLISPSGLRNLEQVWGPDKGSAAEGNGGQFLLKSSACRLGGDASKGPVNREDSDQIGGSLGGIVCVVDSHPPTQPRGATLAMLQAGPPGCTPNCRYRPTRTYIIRILGSVNVDRWIPL